MQIRPLLINVLCPNAAVCLLHRSKKQKSTQQRELNSLRTRPSQGRLWRSWKLKTQNPPQKGQYCPHCRQEDWKREKTWFRCSLRFLGNAIGLANMLPRSNPPQTGPNKAEEPHSSTAHLQRLLHSDDFLYSQLKKTYLCCCFAYFLHWYSSNILVGACCFGQSLLILSVQIL